MTDIWLAGALAALSRWIRLRKKAKQKPGTGVEVNLPEWFKFAIYWGFMIVWIKFVDLIFWILFKV